MNKRGKGVSLEKAADLPKRIIIFIFLIAILLLFGTVTFKLIENISFSAAFFRTLETLAFMFHSQSGVGKLIEIFMALFGVFVIWWILWSVSDMFIEGKISEYLKISRYNNLLKRMANHYIIVGGGRVGEEIAKNLSRLKKDFVIIEKDPVKIDKLRRKSYLVIEGDASEAETEVFNKANLKKADGIFIVMAETSKNLLATLAAKDISPDISIYARADNASFVNRLKKSGAKVVVVPEVTAAEKFMQEFEKD